MQLPGKKTGPVVARSATYQRAAVGALAVLGLLQQTFQDLFVFCFLPGRHEGALRVALQSARAD